MLDFITPPQSSHQSDDYFRQVRREIAPYLPRATRSVLEVGCGAGSTMRWIRSEWPIEFAAGVELSDAAAGVAREVCDEVAVGDVDALPLAFSRERFDAILALDILEHLPQPWHTLSRLRDKLAPGGVLIASIPNVAHLSVAAKLLLRGHWEYTDSGLLDRTHLRFFTRQSACDLFRSAGFAVRDVGETYLGPNLLGWAGLRSARGRWYTRKLLNAARFIPDRWFVLQYLVVATPDPATPAAAH